MEKLRIDLIAESVRDKIDKDYIRRKVETELKYLIDEDGNMIFCEVDVVEVREINKP